MAFTRFSSEDARLQKKLEETTFSGIYCLNTPGNGLHTPFVEDVHIRLQKWGANLHHNSCNVESNFKGLQNPLNRSTLPYKDFSNLHNEKKYASTNGFYINETRTTEPAWKYRELPQQRYDFVFDNPQKHVFKNFSTNLNTRNLEKDFYDKNKN